MGVDVKKIPEPFAKVVKAVRKKFKIDQTTTETLLIVVVTSLLNQVFGKNLSFHVQRRITRLTALCLCSVQLLHFI